MSKYRVVKNEKYKQLKVEVEHLRKQLENERSLRPRWAQGFTSDSIAANITDTALRQLWKELQVDNQTSAVGRLNRIIDERNERFAMLHALWCQLGVTSQTEALERVRELQCVKCIPKR